MEDTREQHECPQCACLFVAYQGGPGLCDDCLYNLDTGDEYDAEDDLPT